MIKRIIIWISILVGIVMLFNTTMPTESAEELSIPSGLGFDVIKVSDDQILYDVTLSSYVFENEMKTTSVTHSGLSSSIGQTRQDRQLQIDKKFLVGLEKVDIIGEAQARYGITNVIDILFSNPSVNDTAQVAVCKGDAKSILKYKVQGYSSAADFIEGMIKSAKNYNFFSDNYRILDIFVRIDSEGRNVTLPYIKLGEQSLEIDGLAIFNKDKMVDILNMEDTRLHNILSKDAGQGIITIQDSSKDYVDYYAKVKRKVICTRVDGKYKFLIKLNFRGEIIDNELDKSISEKDKAQKELENQFAIKIKESLEKFITKLQEQYKVDSLELGRVAAGKYGRDTGTDWNQVISEADIDVDVTVKIDKQGRGDY
jgi:Ger(x)C family germination protein